MDNSVQATNLARGVPDIDIVEVSLLLPKWQAAALEASAHDQGISAAQMVRGLIHDFFAKFARPGCV